MLKFISGFLYRISNTRVVVISVIIFLLFMAFVLPSQSAEAENYSSKAGSPDTSLFYTPDGLYRMAESYGESGRQAYIRARFTFDLIFPFVYGFFLAVCISWLGARVIRETSSLRILNLFPPFGMFFDFLENISTSMVMAQYPLPAPMAVRLASVFTMLKWILVGGSFALLFGLLISWVLVITKKERQ